MLFQTSCCFYYHTNEKGDFLILFFVTKHKKNEQIVIRNKINTPTIILIKCKVLIKFYYRIPKDTISKNLLRKM